MSKGLRKTLNMYIKMISMKKIIINMRCEAVDAVIDIFSS